MISFPTGAMISFLTGCMVCRRCHGLAEGQAMISFLTISQLAPVTIAILFLIG